MSLKRIARIENVGKFTAISPGRDCEFARLTLIYAENASGKTTVSSILQSLGEDRPEIVEGRRRLGAESASKIVIGFDDDTTIVYKDGAWQSTVPFPIEVFNDHFVHENVCAGLEVRSSHRQNLHEVIVGREGVALANELERLNQARSDVRGTLRERERSIPEEVRGALQIKDFCELAEVPEVDDEIAAAGRDVAALEQAETIRSAPALEPTELPAFDEEDFARLLRRTLPDLEEEAIAAVQRHFERYDSTAEEWAGQGVEYLRSDDTEDPPCPFCAQSLLESPLIKHYRGYFSEAYGEHRRTIIEERDRMAEAFGGDAIADLERRLLVMRERVEIWQEFIDLPDLSIDPDELRTAWTDLRDATAHVLDKKARAPLEPMSVPEAVRGAASSYAAAMRVASSINASVAAANQRIEERKAQAGSRDLAAAQRRLRHLEAAKGRHSGEYDDKCEAYLGMLRQEEEIVEERDQAKEALDAYRDEVFPKYQSNLNRLLRDLNAGFTIDAIRPVNPGGNASTQYVLHVNSTAVPLTDGAPNTPGFHNTLSGGDRSTLALAFFLARLELDQDLEDCAVVIDDPLSSMDAGRRHRTVLKVRELATKCRQVVVLSHSKPFLCQVATHSDRIPLNSLEIRKISSEAAIASWDLSADELSEHDLHHETVRGFVNGSHSDTRNTATSLRPLLEGFLRTAYPELYRPGGDIGKFCGRCRESASNGNEILCDEEIRALQELNEYAKRFHHGSNPAYGQALRDLIEDELRGEAARVLDFVTPAPDAGRHRL